MKCIILAAGEGVRLRPLTNDTPKPMVLVAGKPILEHIITALPEKVTDLVIVVGYLQDKITNYFGKSFERFNIDYVVQDGKHGTYHALSLCRHLLNKGEKFLLLYADDIHGWVGLEKCVASEHRSLLVSEAENPRKFGVLEVDAENYITGIEEKPENPKTNLVSAGVLILDDNIFNYPARRHSNGEHYLTDSISQMIADGHKFKAIRSSFWHPIGYPHDIPPAESFLNKMTP